MEREIAQFSALLKARGYSVTRPRLVVFEYLLGKEPVSINTMSKSLSPVIDRASIYRALNLFQQLGITQRHTAGWKYKIELSDMFAEHHHHMTCKKCGKIIPINEEPLEQLVNKLASIHDFVVTQHVIELQGFCSGCNVADL